jgi:hypothetical protein
MKNNWMEKDEEVLLERAFLFGIAGFVISLFPLANAYFKLIMAPMEPLIGVGIALQLFGLSIAVLVLRKRKIKEDARDKAKKMVLVLTIALVFFFLVL